MVDDPNVFTLPEMNYTPLQTSFFDEKPKRKFPLKLLLIPLLFVAATPLLFFAYQNSRASESDAEADQFLTEIAVTRRPTPIITKKNEASGSAIPKESSHSASLEAETKHSSDEADIAIQYYYLDSPNLKKPFDNAKRNQIEKVIDFLKFKETFLEGYSIVMASNSAFIDSKSATISRNRKKIEIKPISEGEKGYALLEDKLIVLSSQLSGDELEAAITHQFGHLVSQMLTPDEFKAFMKSRNMSNIIIDPWYEFWKKQRAGVAPNTEWKKSPTEDFAEVFKMIYGNRKPTPHWRIDTMYGEITASQRIWVINNITSKIKLSK